MPKRSRRNECLPCRCQLQVGGLGLLTSFLTTISPRIVQMIHFTPKRIFSAAPTNIRARSGSFLEESLMIPYKPPPRLPHRATPVANDLSLTQRFILPEFVGVPAIPDLQLPEIINPPATGHTRSSPAPSSTATWHDDLLKNGCLITKYVKYTNKLVHWIHPGQSTITKDTEREEEILVRLSLLALLILLMRIQVQFIRDLGIVPPMDRYDLALDHPSNMASRMCIFFHQVFISELSHYSGVFTARCS